jgi:predicted GNAT family acetyltransferase
VDDYVNNTDSTQNLRWKRVHREELPLCVDFLKEHEAECLNACIRFRKGARAWRLRAGSYFVGQNTRPPAMLLYFKRFLFPIFADCSSVPTPEILPKIIAEGKLYGVQGPSASCLMLEAMLKQLGKAPKDTDDYKIMVEQGNMRPNTQRITVRRASIDDFNALLPLQDAYQREEVLHAGSRWNINLAGLNLKDILENQLVYVAEMGGKTVGKINPSGAGFSLVQIGGVYVAPGFRRLGVASALVNTLTDAIIAGGKRPALFVKTTNTTARRLYARCGFEETGDYRISYY